MQNLLEKLGLGERATSMVVWVGLSLLLLIVVVALAVWLVRTLRPTLNMSGGSGRGGRPQRLAITDAFSLDRDGRKLVIVRRDNVEHLLLIGGPNDVLVESSIVRGERSARDRAGRNAPDSDLHAAETSSGEAPAAAPQATIVAPPPAPATPVAPPVFRPAPPPVAKPAPQAAPRLDDEFERALSAMQNVQRQQAATPPAPPPRATQPAPPPFTPPPFTPPPAPMQAPPAAAAPVSAPPVPPSPVLPPLPPLPDEPAAAAPPPAPAAPARTQPMSEMARRLNEVLQKPLSGTLRPPFNKPIPPVPGTMNSAPRPPAPPVEAEIVPPPPPPPPPPRPPVVEQAPPPASAPAPATGKPGSDHEMDLLEEEMARLLGRPSQPKKPDAP